MYLLPKIRKLAETDELEVEMEKTGDEIALSEQRYQ